MGETVQLDDPLLPTGPAHEQPEPGRPVRPASAMLPLRVSGSYADDAEGDSLGEPTLVPHEGEPEALLDPEHAALFADWIGAKNIADDLDDEVRQRIAAQAKREYEMDDLSRGEWKTAYKSWLDFAMQVSEPKNYPWTNASNVIYPLITTAALQFNARAYPAIVMGRNVVKGSVIGDDRGVAEVGPDGQPLMRQEGLAPGGAPPGMQGMPPGMQGGPGPGAEQQQQQGPPPEPVWLVPPGAKQERADKIGRHMSWQLLSEMPEWEEQTDRLLIVVAVCGTMFRKNYFDPASKRNVSETVDALRLCVNYRAKSFDVAPRYSEEIDFYPWDIETNVRSGLWLDPGDAGYGSNQDGDQQDEQAPVTFIEQHRRWDLDDDGYDEPVIVTFAKNSGKLARIAVGFDANGVEANEDGLVQKITPIRYYTKYGFIPSADGGVYDVGFGHLLFPLNHSINTTINQLLDAGHLQIAGGGFLGSGLSMNSGSVRFMMGEYKVVPTQGKALRENIVPLVMPGPNPVLLSLLQFLVESAREVGSIRDVLTGDMSGANTPGILGLAVIQQGLKVFNAIFKRMHRSLRSDYEKLFRLNRLYLPDQAGFSIGSEYFSIKRDDYDRGAGVEPVSDPDMVTDAQQMAQANFLLEFRDDPHFDQIELRRRVMVAACIGQIDKLLSDKPPPNAQIAHALAQLELEKRLVDLRDMEIKVKAAHQEADQDIRRGKEKASEIELLSRAIKNLADARKADTEVDQNWYELHLGKLKQQIDLLNVAATVEEPSSSPSAAAGLGGGAADILAGLAGGGVPGVAPSPGL